jgi:UDP-N-acetylglucosamine transferase subunit ALG13
MILVTIGTNEQPFDRLVLAAAALDVDEPVVVQYGSCRAVEPREGWMDFTPYDELSELARQARVVVCHAGVGSILMARRAGKLPVVMARRHSLGEAVDDHQVELSRRLASSGLVTLVDDAADLASAVRTVTGTGGETVVKGLPGAAALAADLRLQLQRIAA